MSSRESDTARQLGVGMFRCLECEWRHTGRQEHGRWVAAEVGEQQVLLRAAVGCGQLEAVLALSAPAGQWANVSGVLAVVSGIAWCSSRAVGSIIQNLDEKTTRATSMADCQVGLATCRPAGMRRRLRRGP